jgi:hypothetical protein
MLIGIFGSFGSGKTLLLTYIALKYAEMENYDVYANYHIKHEKVKVIEPEDFIEINPESSDKRVFIALDEIYAWLDSRFSLSKVNRLLSWVILQSRKRNMDIGYTAQMSGTVDLRMRGMTDLVVVAENINDGFKYAFIWEKGLKTYKRVLMLNYKNAEKIWDLYDTREIVKPIGLEELAETLKPKAKSRKKGGRND